MPRRRELQHTETLYRNGSVKQYGRIWIRKLTQSEEARGAARDVSRTLCLQVETEAGSKSGKDNNKYAEGHSELRHCMGHGEHAGADDCRQ